MDGACRVGSPRLSLGSVMELPTDWQIPVAAQATRKSSAYLDR
jgi:hypothetical protein